MGMDRDRDFSLKAMGNVTGSRFVKYDVTEDHAGLQAGANERTCGIAIDGSRNAPGSLGDDGFIAIDGETIPVFGPGAKCLLELGGTVTRGQRLISNATGQGVAAATTGTVIQEVGAEALESGVSGQRVLVEVIRYPYRPAIA